MKAHTTAALFIWVGGTVLLGATFFSFSQPTQQSTAPAPGYTPVSAQDHFPADLMDFHPFSVRGTASAPNLSSAVWFNSGAQEIRITRCERADAASEWHEYAGVVTTSFRVTDIAARQGGEELYVAGIADNGDDIIERWTARARTGGWAMRSAITPASPIGTPMPPYSVVHSIVGGTFIVPGPREQVVPERTVIYRGTTMGHVRSMEADPEGRFLLLLSYTTGTLYRLDLLPSPPQLNIAFASNAIPHLSDVKSVWIGQFASQGRKCRLSEVHHGSLPETHRFTVLDDANNDGVFETHTTLTSSEWAASPFADPTGTQWKHLWDQSPPLNTSGQ